MKRRELREETRSVARSGGVKSRAWAAAGAGSSVAVGIALAAGALGVLFRVMSAPAFSVAAASAIAASGALAVLAWRAPRLAIGAAFGTACALVPNIVVGCSSALAAPLASLDARADLTDFGLVFIGVIIVFLGTVAAFPLAALVSALRLRAERVMVVIAACVALSSAFVTARGFASMSRPEPDDFAGIFDETSSLEGGHRLAVGATTLFYAPSSADMCSLHISGDSATSDALLGAVDGRCPALTVFHDRRSDVGLVVPGDARIAARPLAILRTKDHRAEIPLAELAGELGAPRGWLFGASVGLVLAAFAIAASIAAARRRTLDTAVDATHLGDGWVSLDGAKRHVASLAGSPAGPVVVTTRAARGATYREDGSPLALDARTGTKESLRDEIATRVVAWSCVAIATIAMTSAPLWVARVSGLL
ncbi:MAG TPA: hypothetical protein VGH28_33055 [Polyangiaceae bacterium]